ncbi:MAG: 2-amino-4-oxopentanoate thiolase subunit OrtB [Spirochaetota bacterium]
MAYQDVMERRGSIIRKSVGIDYEHYRTGTLAFDYERLLSDTGYTLEETARVQAETAVGKTPLVELKNLTRLVRKVSLKGKGGRIFVKDEAANPSGSFKDRRASLSVYEAKKRSFPGVAAATSGNYGAAVASQAAKYGLPCIIVQEAFDSRGIAQPEILEKARACEAYGAEVVRLSVGPELFYVFLLILEETGFFNASLYTPFSVLGIETLGYEIAVEIHQKEGVFPDVVVATHAGGGNITGTGRGLLKAGARHTRLVGASVDLQGLHMASDRDFNRKSFTTGHTGFGVPFASWPDRTDVPFNAARPLRYMDRYVTVTQGEVFYITQALAELEGMERGPAGNTSLAAGFSLARQMEEHRILVVQETEYTGAGKHPIAQLNQAMAMGIEVKRGDPKDNIPGTRIVLPEHPSQIEVQAIDLDRLRRAYIRKALSILPEGELLQDADRRFILEDTRVREDLLDKILYWEDLT